MHEELTANALERGIIGGIISEGSKLLSLAQSKGACPDWFNVSAIRYAYEACASLAEKNLEIDEITVAEELRSRGRWTDVGGDHTLIEWTNTSETYIFFEAWLVLLRSKYIQRQAHKAAAEIKILLEEPATDTETLFQRIAAPLSHLNGLSLAKDSVSLRQRLTAALEQDVARYNGDAPAISTSGLTFGLHTVDEKFFPVQPGEQIILAGRPSEGKSSLMRQFAYPHILSGKTVAIFSLEVPDVPLVKRLAALEPEVPVSHRDLRYWARDAGNGPRRVQTYFENWQHLTKLADESFHCFSGRLTIEAIEAKCRLIHRRFGRLDLICVDYLQLCESSERTNSREQEVAKISRRLKLLGGELDAATLVLSQLNRDIPPTGPELRNLRESGAIEQDADRVWFVWRPDKDALGHEQRDTKSNGDPRKSYQQKIKQAKGRDYGTCETWLIFKCETTKFHDVPPEGSRGRPRKTPVQEEMPVSSTNNHSRAPTAYEL